MITEDQITIICKREDCVYNVTRTCICANPKFKDIGSKKERECSTYSLRIEPFPVKMKKTKWLVRPDDFMIWEIDPSNGCYRAYEETKVKNRHHAYDHFTFENLTKNYGWFPITKKEIPKYLKEMHFHYGFLSWQSRNDGHGEAKGGTLGEYLQHLESVKRWKLLKEKEEKKIEDIELD